MTLYNGGIPGDNLYRTPSGTAVDRISFIPGTPNVYNWSKRNLGPPLGDWYLYETGNYTTQ
jgi:hypothetical protein